MPSFKKKVQSFFTPSKNESVAKIIVIDSDQFLMEVLEAALKSKGNEFMGFSKGKDALKFFEDSKLDKGTTIVLLERVLSDMDGLEVLDRILAKFGRRIPVVVISQLISEQDVVEGLQHGAIAYVQKPFNLKILTEKIESLAAWWSERAE